MHNHEKLAGEIFELLIQDEEPTRLLTWMTMMETELLKQRGYRDGRYAGSWVFDGNSSDETVAKIQKGIEDGDPEILDQLPSPGGEWADSPMWFDILGHELNIPNAVWSEMDTDYLWEAYNEGFTSGVSDEVMSWGKRSEQV